MFFPDPAQRAGQTAPFATELCPQRTQAGRSNSLTMQNDISDGRITAHWSDLVREEHGKLGGRENVLGCSAEDDLPQAALCVGAFDQ